VHGIQDRYETREISAYYAMKKKMEEVAGNTTPGQMKSNKVVTTHGRHFYQINIWGEGAGTIPNISENLLQGVKYRFSVISR